jgi:SanA protein
MKKVKKTILWGTIVIAVACLVLMLICNKLVVDNAKGKAFSDIYKAGKIGKILISGDENSLDGINEPECMKDSLVARGVPANAIILDGKGYRTICSVVNANKIFGLKSFTIISQEFHNERALYQAEHLGLDVENIQAYNAEMPKSRRAYLTSIREYFARVKMFWDLLTY